MEEANDETDKSLLRLFPKVKYCRTIAIAVIGCTVAYLHSVYIASLYENNLNFSHLSRLEREMALRSEMGFYYSYYKTVVEERPLLAAITKLMYDRTVEYPKEVNALNRFNIYPEVLIGCVYRYLEPWLLLDRRCHTVLRPGGAPVESCVGLGEPVVFYLQAVWLVAGVTAGAVFVFGVGLSGSMLGGIWSLAAYLSNHGHCSRAAWAPNQRETLAQPLLLLQMCLLTRQLRGGGTLQAQVGIFLLNALCLVCWQFSQFVFLTQTAIVFVMEQLRIVDTKALWVHLHAAFCGLHLALLLLQGNDLLRSSLYVSFFIVVSLYCLLFSSLRIKVQTRLDLFVESWLIFLRIGIVICASFWLKGVIQDFLNVEEDTHIWEILYSKFSDFKNFHTMLYTCSPVFDFLPFETWKDLTFSSLIPVTVITVLNSVYFWYRHAREAMLKPPETDKKAKKADDDSESDEDSGIENLSEAKSDERNNLNVVEQRLKEKSLNKKPKDSWIEFLRHLDMDSGLFYNVSQMCVFGVLATLVMRLKLLFVPHMCLVSSLVVNLELFPASPSARRWARAGVGLLLLWVTAGIARTVREETSHVGEFSDPACEELLSWAVTRGGARAVYAAPAPLAAAILLSARRAIVNHPHYEHRDARERNFAVYKTYGRFSPTELYQDLGRLRVTHLVVDKGLCYHTPRSGCSLGSIWDAHVPSHALRPRTCDSLLRGTPAASEHFYRVFDNERYTVLRVHDYSVQYSPRALDT